MTGEIVEVRPDEEHHEQLVLLPAATFDLIRTLADAGAITVTSLEIDKPLTLDQADALSAWLGLLKRSSSWWIGDLLNQLEQTHPAEFSQLCQSTNLAESTLLSYQFVCAAVPPSRRKANLGFSHHAKVARLSAKEQKAWLDKASKNQWTYGTLVEEMAAKRREMRPQLPGTEDDTPGTVDRKLVVEVAEAILRDAHEHPEDPNNYLVPVEDIVRLRAAFGQED